MRPPPAKGYHPAVARRPFGKILRYLSGRATRANGPDVEIVNRAEVRYRGADDAAARAVRAGAQGPLTWLGAGETAHVFRDASGAAWKTARGPSDVQTLAVEADWLRDAGRVPGVAEHVATLRRWHPAEGVIERDCPMPRQRRTDERRLLALHNLVSARMWPLGWTSPEWKLDSWVWSVEGPKLVDAGRARMVGWKYARYVADVLAGRRPPLSFERGELVAWLLRRDAPSGLGADVIERLAARVETSWPSAPPGAF